MAKGDTKDHMTLTVVGSSALGRPDGRAAIQLVTKELGAIAFEVDRQAIDVLRRDLAAAEQMLPQPKAKN